MSNKTVSGIPSSVQDSSEHSLIFYKNIAKTILPLYGIQSGLIDDQYDLLVKLIGLCEVFKSLVTANVDGDVIEISPNALLGFIDSILAQANAIHVVHDELVEQLSNRNKEVK